MSADQHLCRNLLHLNVKGLLELSHHVLLLDEQHRQAPATAARLPPDLLLVGLLEAQEAQAV
eukprot:CAMPEP_0179279322 /NCGR_PEP_ID=MMETSP0797-20121207/36054_1 /TAXON_ID=47934 /ORGANISM="Dinophysis acuminata, Strain DAEP01" /LENGTH=61 /DNA_ID=CAMNT_0020987947 /DNA_START=22 /DNA_END=203 /DNA_ORIENTATION=-